MKKPYPKRIKLYRVFVLPRIIYYNYGHIIEVFIFISSGLKKGYYDDDD